MSLTAADLAQIQAMIDAAPTVGEGFPQPIVAGQNLLIPGIQSPNFSLTSETGWAILKNGLAYFFSVVLSGGTLTGPDYIINPSGIFIYNGTPANGNLIGSWAGAAGTDTFGNPYPQGLNVSQGDISGSVITGSVISGPDWILNSAGFFQYASTPALGNLTGSWASVAGTDGLGNTYLAGFTAYNKATGQYVQIATSAQASGGPGLVLGSGNPNEPYDSAASIEANTPGYSGALGYGVTTWTGPGDNTFLDLVGFIMQSAQHGGAVGALGELVYVNGAGVTIPLLQWGCPSASGGTPVINALTGLGFVNQTPTPVAQPGTAQLWCDANQNLERLLPSGRSAPLSDGSGAVGTFAVTTTAYGPISPSWGIPANDMKVGTTYTFEAWGLGVQGSTAEVLTIGFNLAGTDNTITVPSTFVGINTTFSWHMRIRVQCTVAGASGSYSWFIDLVTQSNTVTSGLSFNREGSGVAINTGAAFAPHLEAKWGSASVGCSITAQGNTFERTGT
jgi:hypothetical protein